MNKEPKNRDNEEADDETVDKTAREAVESTESFRDYDREFRSNYLTSDEY